MTDIEILRFVASMVKIPGNQDSDGGFVFIKRFSEQPGDIGAVKWNPLDDDGDAFQLAVQLHINIHLSARTFVETRTEGGVALRYQCDYVDRDRMMRRAIVLAAVEIGKMKNNDPTYPQQ